MARFFEKLKKDLCKRISSRIRLWFSTALLLILIDEYLKEGYVFRFRDIGQPYPTHENIFVALAVLWSIFELLRRFSRRRSQ